MDRLLSAEAGDAPLSVLYINRHNHSMAPGDSPGGEGQESSSDWLLPGGTPAGGQQALSSLSAEDLARAMYTDLMQQLSESGRTEGNQHTGLAAASAGGDSGEDLSQDRSMHENRRLASEAEELLSALLEASNGVVVAPAASADPGLTQGSRSGDSVLATSSSDAFGADSSQAVASATPLLPEPCADSSVFAAPSADPLSYSESCSDQAFLTATGANSTPLIPRSTEDSSWKPSLALPRPSAPTLRLPYPRLNRGPEGSKWAEGDFTCNGVQGEMKPSVHGVAQQRRKAESPLQVPPTGLIVDWDVSQLLESVMGPPTARSGSNWSSQEQRTQEAAGTSNGGNNMA